MVLVLVLRAGQLGPRSLLLRAGRGQTPVLMLVLTLLLLLLVPT